MADVLQILQDIMSLTKTVGALEHTVEKLGEKVENHTERIVKLEQREDVIIEKMTTRALTAVNEMTGRVFEKLASLEHRLPQSASEK
jgi:phage shock protein A